MINSYEPAELKRLENIRIGQKKDVKAAMKSDQPAEIKKALEKTEKFLGDIKKYEGELKPHQPKANVSKSWENLIKKSMNSRVFKYFENKKYGVGLGLLLVAGNFCKEVVGTAMYTIQGLTNEDLAPDKRKFIGMYDLAVGGISTTLGLLAGLATIRYQEPVFNKIFKKMENNPSKYKLFGAALSGLTMILPLAFQTILMKRIIAPAVGTPIAGRLKKKMEEKESAKQGQKQPGDYKIPVELTVPLKFKDTQNAPAAQNTMPQQPATDILDIYKKAAENANKPGQTN